MPRRGQHLRPARRPLLYTQGGSTWPSASPRGGADLAPAAYITRASIDLLDPRVGQSADGRQSIDIASAVVLGPVTDINALLSRWLNVPSSHIADVRYDVENACVIYTVYRAGATLISFEYGDAARAAREQRRTYVYLTTSLPVVARLYQNAALAGGWTERQQSTMASRVLSILTTNGSIVGFTSRLTAGQRSFGRSIVELSSQSLIVTPIVDLFGPYASGWQRAESSLLRRWQVVTSGLVASYVRYSPDGSAPTVLVSSAGVYPPLSDVGVERQDYVVDQYGRPCFLLTHVSHFDTDVIMSASEADIPPWLREWAGTSLRIREHSELPIRARILSSNGRLSPVFGIPRWAWTNISQYGTGRLSTTSRWVRTQSRLDGHARRTVSDGPEESYGPPALEEAGFRPLTARFEAGTSIPPPLPTRPVARTTAADLIGAVPNFIIAGRSLEFDERRPYGVEIETVGLGVSSTIEALRNTKKHNIRDEGYSHAVKPYWKVVGDSSIDGRHAGELVSPPMRGQAGLDELRRICNDLPEYSVVVNRSCGVHVHHSYDLDERNYAAVPKLLLVYRHWEQDAIDFLVAPSRRGLHPTYCNSLHTIEEARFTAAMRGRAEVWALAGSLNRYYKVNITPLRSYGTIEFRQHNGTVDGEDIANWIIFTQLLMQASAKNVNESFDGYRRNWAGLMRWMFQSADPGPKARDALEYLEKKYIANKEANGVDRRRIARVYTRRGELFTKPLAEIGGEMLRNT